ncbi:hypothetical protein [Corynebacterium sp.]|uniref:hypothetical protein n=1 Tax=Corynebacterium sp. TaxID=1720 RepID=UPI0026DCDB91|nr:hypothetical protein [Corynebacterium sp.]MDO5033137.1 hypothetical protein [Corynebacterium sp.]
MNNTGPMNASRLSAVLAVTGIGVFALWGGWLRRWICDDGLIVLRTVRNLEAGNGPVFNAGERVEANTSTLWQYLILFVRWLTQLDLAAIAIYLGLAFSVAAMVLGTWATAKAARGVVVPAGALVYLALPPARDFFTSGLEWGLSIFYLAALWALLVRWVRVPGNTSAYWLALWAGLSWLVRPELALYGGFVGLLLLATHRSWRAWAGIFACALPIPAGYQFFRMGYYGLLTPHTAVAKSASESAWAYGWTYLRDLFDPYALYLPLVALALAALWRAPLRPAGLRTQATVTYVMVGTALLHTLYVLRVGGDFMHGRMLLLPLFAALLPVFVLRVRSALTVLVAALCAVWAVVIILRGHPTHWADYEKSISIVDERDFWTYATHREAGHPPRRLQDFTEMKLVTNYADGIRGLENGDGMAFIYLESEDPDVFGWGSLPRDDSVDAAPTVYMVNMGMASGFAPLYVRVLDNIGLATPVAARQPRIPDGRIGHDKNLSIEWQAALAPVDLNQLPPWYDKDEAKRARAALASPEFQELFASYRDPLTVERFFKNIRFALGPGRTLTLDDDPSVYLAR